MTMESAPETERCAPKAHSLEPSTANGVEEGILHRRAEESGASFERGARHEARPAKKPGRPKPRRQVRVIRIDSQKYPQFRDDREHPFASMAAEARIREIDAFCARLWARTKKEEVSATGQVRPIAA